jgi:hypothetical protein
VIHVDDGCAEGDDDILNKFFAGQMEVLMLKETGRLEIGDSADKWAEFLGRKRCRIGSGFGTRVLSKCAEAWVAGGESREPSTK